VANEQKQSANLCKTIALTPQKNLDKTCSITCYRTNACITKIKSKK